MTNSGWMGYLRSRQDIVTSYFCGKQEWRGRRVRLLEAGKVGRRRRCKITMNSQSAPIWPYNIRTATWQAAAFRPSSHYYTGRKARSHHNSYSPTHPGGCFKCTKVCKKVLFTELFFWPMIVSYENVIRVQVDAHAGKNECCFGLAECTKGPVSPRMKGILKSVSPFAQPNTKYGSESIAPSRHLIENP